MVKINVHEAKANLSRYLDQAVGGEEVVICKRNVPIVKLTPVVEKRSGRRPVGIAKGTVKIHDSFFDPMNEEELREWYGDEP